MGVVASTDRVTCLITGAVLQAVCFVCAGHGGARQTRHAQGAQRRRCGAHDSRMYSRMLHFRQELVVHRHSCHELELHGAGIGSFQLRFIHHNHFGAAGGCGGL